MEPQHLKRALLTLAGTLQSFRLYPHRHPVVRQQLESCMAALTTLLDQTDHVRLKLMDGTLFFEDLPLLEQTPAADEMRNHLERLKLQGLEFCQGLTLEELYDGLDLVGAGTCTGDAFEEALTVRGVHRLLPIRDRRDNASNALASRIYRRAIAVVDKVCGDVRLGRIPSSLEAIGVVRDMVQQTLAEPHSLFALSLLKDYDNYTFQHSVNVSVIAMTVGKACGLSPSELEILGLGGLLHDLGKLTVPIDIINKPGRLTREEYEEIKQHPGNGANIAAQMESVPQGALDIIRGHHLRYDRSGYPADSRGGMLSPLTDMATIADCFDAMTTLRVYQRPLTVREALKAMSRAAGQALHPEYLKAFVAFIGPYPVGSLVRLDSNEVGLVVRTNPANDGTEVELKILFDASGHAIDPPTRRTIPSGMGHALVAEVDPFLRGVNIPDFLD